MLEKIRVLSNVTIPGILQPPYHLIWRIAHGFLWVHVHEIHNASEVRQKCQFHPKWSHLGRGMKRCQKKFCTKFSCSTESNSHISKNGTVSVNQQAHHKRQKSC